MSKREADLTFTLKIRQGLYELKNKYASGFIMINAMWVAAIFMLQKHQDQLNVRWPLGEKVQHSPFLLSHIT